MKETVYSDGGLDGQKASNSTASDLIDLEKAPNDV